MLRRATRNKASVRTILRDLHREDMYFPKLREKPDLTDKDFVVLSYLGHTLASGTQKRGKSHNKTQNHTGETAVQLFPM